MMGTAYSCAPNIVVGGKVVEVVLKVKVFYVRIPFKLVQAFGSTQGIVVVRVNKRGVTKQLLGENVVPSGCCRSITPAYFCQIVLNSENVSSKISRQINPVVFVKLPVGLCVKVVEIKLVVFNVWIITQF